MTPVTPCCVRRARPEDLDALVALEAVFPSDRLSRADLARSIANPNRAVLVAVAEEAVLGAAVVTQTRPRRSRLYSLAVRDDAQGRGIGSTLTAAAEAYAADRGSTRLSLEVRTDNGRALSVYEKRGFRSVRRLPAYYSDGQGAARLAKELTASPGT